MNDLPPRHQCAVRDHEAETGGGNRNVDAGAAATIAVHRHQDFDGRILPFDARAASAYAEIFAARRQSGRPIETPDLIVAATAHTHNAVIVTRDTGGFEGCGIPLINPREA